MHSSDSAAKAFQENRLQLECFFFTSRFIGVVSNTPIASLHRILPKCARLHSMSTWMSAHSQGPLWGGILWYIIPHPRVLTASLQHNIRYIGDGG